MMPVAQEYDVRQLCSRWIRVECPYCDAIMVHSSAEYMYELKAELKAMRGGEGDGSGICLRMQGASDQRVIYCDETSLVNKHFTVEILEGDSQSSNKFILPLCH